jgi:hypothetical protein
MFEVDFRPATISEKSGDAIALRFPRPDTVGTAGVVVDAGFVGIGNDSSADPET